MSIPKKIHYCWFGRQPLPKSVSNCIASWKHYCPDYEIIQWNESNFDVNAIRYTREAYEKKQWAFVSDYARIKIIYENGGIYLDTDVELIKPLNSLLQYEGFMGFQNRETIATGLGFGAVARHPVIRALLEDYKTISFVKEDGSIDQTPCPDRNTKCLQQLGLKADGTRQELWGIQIFPSEYFSPMDWKSGQIKKTVNTYSIHHYAASWLTKEEYRWMKVQQLIGTFAYNKLRYGIVNKFCKLLREKEKITDSK